MKHLHGLILAGGFSKRMGQDKGAMVYHQKPQVRHLVDLLTPLCARVSVSCRQDQAQAPHLHHLDLIFDIDLDCHGEPSLGILSAMNAHPTDAFFVVACDMPFIDEATLRFLIEHRHPSSVATCFKSPEKGWPDPLCAIWEPEAYGPLLESAKNGKACPRKFLMNHEAIVLDCPFPLALRNINTSDEFKALQS